MVVQRWNRQFGCETIHPTQKFTSMNLFKMPCLITQSWSFLISEVVEAVRGQKHHILHTIASMPSLLGRSQILIGSEVGQYIPTVVHTVWELQLWTKEIVEGILVLREATVLHFGTLTQSHPSHSASSAYQKLTKKLDQLWLSATIKPPYLEF